MSLMDKVKGNFNIPNGGKEILKEIKQVWSAQTIKDLLNGTLIISYDLINKQLAEHSISPSVSDIVISPVEDNLLNIKFKHEQYGDISCTGEILAFNHNDKESYLSFKIKEKEIKAKNIISKIITVIGYCIFIKLLGKFPKFSDEINVSMTEDILKVDFREYLLKSNFNKKIMGKDTINLVDVLSLEPSVEGIKVNTNLKVSPVIKKMMEFIIK